jgi:hypothetical protein
VRLDAIRTVLSAYRSTEGHITEGEITAAWAEFDALRENLSGGGIVSEPRTASGLSKGSLLSTVTPPSDEKPSLTDRTFRWEREGTHGYLGAVLHTYQLTLGLSLRWYAGQPHVRLYVGPLKVYAGLFLRPGQPAFTGGDR